MIGGASALGLAGVAGAAALWWKHGGAPSALPPAAASPSPVPTAVASPWPSASASASGPSSSDQSAVQALLDKGGRVVLEARDYLLSVSANREAALVLSVPGTTLVMAPQTRLRLRPSAFDSYAILRIKAKGCRVEGGHIIGDLAEHAGDKGEWGHGVEIAAGASDAVLEGVEASDCWGDGFYVTGGVSGVSFNTCTAQGNRRQGLSIVNAGTVAVRGGEYAGSGRYRGVSPSAGADVEPGPGQQVGHVTFDGVRFTGSGGPGLVISSALSPVQVDVRSCISEGNATGFLIAGKKAQVSLAQCQAKSNRVGYYLHTAAESLVLHECVSEGNSTYGASFNGPVSVTDCRFSEPRNRGI